MTRALALRAIADRPVRALLTWIAVALGIAIVLGVAVTVNGLTGESQAAVAAAAGSSGLDVRVTAGAGLTFDEAATLARLPGVAAAAPLYAKRDITRVNAADVAGVTATIVALKNGAVALRPLSLASGRLPASGSHADVVLDSGFASVLAATEHISALRLGDSIQLTTVTGPDQFTIVGFSNGGGGSTAAFTRSAVYVTEAAMLSQFNLGLHTALVALQLQPGAASADVATEVTTALGGTVTTLDPRAAAASPLQEVQPLLLLVTVLSVVVGAGATANSVALAISERRREVGLLRAAGASSRHVFRLFMLEVLIVAVAAIPAGVAAGIGIAALLEARLTPSDLPLPGLDITALDVLLAAVAGVGAALIGGALAARGAGRSILASLSPRPGSDRERLRTLPLAFAPPLLTAGALMLILGDGAVVAAGATLLLAGVLAALPLIAPFLARLVGTAANALTPLGGVATRNLVRRRNRTALTLSGLTIAIACAVAVSALSVGAVSGGDDWVTHLFAGDVVVRSPVTQTQQVADTIATSNGVRQAFPLRFLATSSGTDVYGVTAINAPAYASVSALVVTTGARAAAFRQVGDSASFLAPQALASKNNWSVGQSIRLATLGGTTQFVLAGIVEHSFPAGNGAETLLIDRNQALTYFGPTAAGFDDLDVVTAGNSSGVDDSAASFGLSAVTVSDIRDSAERALNHALALLLAVAIIALVISMIAVVNTLLVNVRQGRRDVSLMRAVGLDRSAALRLVLTEAAVLAASGAVLGVATGCILVVGMVHAVATPGFSPGFTFPLIAALAVVAAVIGGSVIATVLPAVRASRSSIVAAIHRD